MRSTAHQRRSRVRSVSSARRRRETSNHASVVDSPIRREAAGPGRDAHRSRSSKGQGQRRRAGASHQRRARARPGRAGPSEGQRADGARRFLRPLRHPAARTRPQWGGRDSGGRPSLARCERRALDQLRGRLLPGRRPKGDGRELPELRPDRGRRPKWRKTSRAPARARPECTAPGRAAARSAARAPREERRWGALLGSVDSHDSRRRL